MGPYGKIAVVACMDARVDVDAVLGRADGVAHVIRNAGGVVTDDAIRSLAISQNLLGTTEIVVIQHTDCGMLKFTDDELRAKLAEVAGEEPSWSPGAFDDLERSVRDSIARIESSPFIPSKDSIRGFVYELETGELREVR